MSTQQPFSVRQGLISMPAIQYRDDLPARLREPIFQILRRYLPSAFLWERVQAIMNPYGIDEMPRGAPVAIAKEEDNPNTVAAKQALMNCEWFRVYDVLEDLYSGLVVYEAEYRPARGSFAVVLPSQPYLRLPSGFPSIAADPIATSRFPSVADRNRATVQSRLPLFCRAGCLGKRHSIALVPDRQSANCQSSVQDALRL